MIKCDNCGKFMAYQSGVSWMMVYSGFPLEPYGEIFRCLPCCQRLGPFTPQHGIKPEYSCGVVA